MFLQFLPFRIEEAGATITMILAAGASIGGVLWLAGARFSRSLVALASVTIGAGLGLRLPGLLGLSVSTWATAIGGALVLGLSGYLLQRLWIAGGLILVVAVWMAAATWGRYGTGPVSDLVTQIRAIKSGDYVNQAWQLLPSDIKRLGPVYVGVAGVGALVIALLWARLASLLFYSMLGVTMMVVLGISAIELARPQMLTMIPTRPGMQIAVLLGMVLFGVVAQWRLTSAPAVKAQPDDDARDEKE